MTYRQRTVLITGGTSGIGYQAAIRMINSKHNLIILCRNKARQEYIYSKMRNEIPDFINFKDNVHLPIVDLSDLKSIESFNIEIIKNRYSLDSIILNAGLQYTGSKSARRSKQEIELTFAVNHLSHHYLINRFIENLFGSEFPKIIVTSSEVHNPLSPGGRVGLSADLGDLKGLEDESNFLMLDGSSSFNADKAYKDSKLCNILFSKELAKRLSLANKKIPVICWAPGLVIPRSNEGFFRYSRKNNEIGQRLFALLSRDILKITESPMKAGELLAKLDNSNEYINKRFIYISNKLISLSKHKLIEDQTSLESNDSFKANKLWELSTNLISKYCDTNSFYLS